MPRRTTGGDGKKVPLNMRTTQALRDKINAAAGVSGRSLVQEVEYRVELSFEADKQEVLIDLIDEIAERIFAIELRLGIHTRDPEIEFKVRTNG